MLTIIVDSYSSQEVADTISSIDRLNELVSIKLNAKNTDLNYKTISVSNNFIIKPIDWHDYEPPYIFPKTILNKNNLLAIVFFKIGNYQRALKYADSNKELHQHILIATQLKLGYRIEKETYNNINNSHNLCIVLHYGKLSFRYAIEELIDKYKETLKSLESNQLKAFTAKHYINLLLDLQKHSEAEKIAKEIQDKALTKDAENEINVQLANALMSKITIPYKKEKLTKIKSLLYNSISFYEEKQLLVNAGLLLIDASKIVSYQKEFADSNKLINKAILYFKKTNTKEFVGEAILQKSTLLYNWSKNGSLQYYKSAISSYQEALKIFTKDAYPEKFAEIHHKIALIYSEIPASEKEKAIWCAFSASSFKKALLYYSKEEFPYEYAMICHNYATALIQFPESKLGNNYTKAFDLFEEALDVRSAKNYPFERASTLTNQLELYWLINNKNEELLRWNEMNEKIKEIKALTTEKSILKNVAIHKESLERLNNVICTKHQL